MALNTEAENLRDEIRGAVKFRDEHLAHFEELLKRFHGRHYRRDQLPLYPQVENVSFELQSLLMPSLAYDNPKCIFTTSNPSDIDEATRMQLEVVMAQVGVGSPHELARMYGMDLNTLVQQLGGHTMQSYAKALELACNRWSVNNEINRPCRMLASDFLYCWGVGFVTLDDQPGWQGHEFKPQQPIMMRLDPRHFFLDAHAHTPDVYGTNGPRIMGHQWKADYDDLEDAEEYDADAVSEMRNDNDVEKYDFERDRGLNLPMRNEVVLWDNWIPEDGWTEEELVEMGYDPECVHGSIHTVAANRTREGISKNTYKVREKRPAYVPPWGPYALFGYHMVQGDPYPLGLMTSLAERMEGLNRHVVAAAEDAAAYKRFVATKMGNSADSDRVKRVRNGEVVMLDNPEDIQNIEIGGVTDKQMKWVSEERQMLRRLSGISESRSGEPTDDVSATAEAIADQGVQTRLAGLKARFREGVAQCFRSAAWYMHHADSVILPMGEEGANMGMDEFMGGQKPFRFHDLSMTIDPYSLEHTDQGIVQRRITGAIQAIQSAAPIMPQTTFIPWSQLFRRYFETLNLGEFEIDDQLLSMLAQMQMQPGPAESGMRGEGDTDLRIDNAQQSRKNGEMQTEYQPGDDMTSQTRSHAVETARALVG